MDLREGVWLPVSSACLTAVRFAEPALDVQFRRGKAYRYYGVTWEVFWGLMNAASRGSYYARQIRGMYTCEPISA